MTIKIKRSEQEGNPLPDKVRRYLLLKERVEALDEQLGEMKAELVDEVKAKGFGDDKGHLWLDLEGIEGASRLKYEHRVSQWVSMEKAEPILRAAGLWDRCHHLEPVLDEDQVLLAHAEGLLEEADIDAMVEKKEYWAFKVIK